MSSLEDVYDGGSRRRVVARAVVLLVGSFVAVVGFVAASASLVAGFGHGKTGALKISALLGGALLLGTFLVLFLHGAPGSDSKTPHGPSRTLAVVGTVFGVVGLTLFWTTLPAGWTGSLADLPATAVGSYAVGLLAVFVAVFAGTVDAENSGVGATPSDERIGDSEPGRTDESESVRGVESAMTTGPSEGATGRATSTRDGPASAVGDGGEDEDTLQFFDDEDA